MSDRGYWATHQDGERYWHEAPERSGCGGTGYIRCYCGGDLCVCGNFGEIECDGCPDCYDYDDDDFDEDDE